MRFVDQGAEHEANATFTVAPRARSSFLQRASVTESDAASRRRESNVGCVSHVGRYEHSSPNTLKVSDVTCRDFGGRGVTGRSSDVCVSDIVSSRGKFVDSLETMRSRGSVDLAVATVECVGRSMSQAPLKDSRYAEHQVLMLASEPVVWLGPVFDVCYNSDVDVSSLMILETACQRAVEGANNHSMPIGLI